MALKISPGRCGKTTSNTLSSKWITKLYSEPSQTELRINPSAAQNESKPYSKEPKPYQSAIQQRVFPLPSSLGLIRKLIKVGKFRMFQPYANPYSDSGWVALESLLLFTGFSPRDRGQCTGVVWQLMVGEILEDHFSTSSGVGSFFCH